MRITHPEHAYHWLFGRMNPEVEEFWALALNSDKRILATECLFRGTTDLCLFHPRDVFRFAYRHNASALLVAHNHPSGNPLPSPEDAEITQRLIQASRILEVPVVDHLILGSRGYYSFLQAGKLGDSESLSI